MQNFITDKISILPKFDDKILKILHSFDTASHDDEIISRIMNNIKFESKILSLAFCRFVPETSDKTMANAFKIYGREGMRAFFLFAVFDAMLLPNLECYKMDRKRFSEISLVRNLFMNAWIKFYPQISPDILSSTILMDFGRVFIDEYVMSEGKEGQFYTSIKNCYFPQDFTDVEIEFADVYRESVGYELYCHFGLDKIANDIRYSDDTDEAPIELKQRCEMLKVAKTGISIYHCFDERSIDNALNLLVEFGMEQESFLEAKREIRL